MGQADVVTEAQQQLSVLCSHFYATLGSLQRDAPPLSIHGEELLASGVADQPLIGQQTKLMAQQVIQASKRLAQLLSHLPDVVDSEKRQTEVLQPMYEQHKQASIRLETALQEARATMMQIEDRYAEVVDQHLGCHDV